MVGTRVPVLVAQGARPALFLVNEGLEYAADFGRDLAYVRLELSLIHWQTGQQLEGPYCLWKRP